MIDYDGVKVTRLKPLLVLMAVAFLVLLAGDLAFVKLRDAAKEDQKNQITAIDRLKANQISDWLDDRHSDIKTLSVDSYFAKDVAEWQYSSRLKADQRERIINRLGAFIEAHHYYSISIYDIEGRHILRAGKHIEHEEDMGIYARRVMASGEVEMVDLHRHNDASLPVSLGFMSPLRVGDKFVGAIYFSENPMSYLFPLLASWPSASESGEVHLIRADGDRVLFLSDLRKREDAPLTFSLPLDTPDLAAAKAVLGKSGLLEHAHDYGGAPVLAYATAIAGTPWVLISSIAEEEAYALVNRIEQTAILSVAFIFIMFATWFWQWWRRVQSYKQSALLQQKLQADEALLEVETQYHNLFDNASVPILEEDFSLVKAYFRQLEASGVTDLRSHFAQNPEEAKACAAKVKIISANKLGLDFFGVHDKEELTRHLPKYFVDESWGQFTGELIALAEGALRFEYEIPMRNGRGERRELLLTLSIAENNLETLGRVLISFIDITERKQSESRINFLAYHDRLTGLPNRTLFFDRLSQGISQARRSHKHVALLFLDLDGFKPVNDNYGHEAGDAVLKMVAQRLLACVRAVDTVARLGGDEFAIIAGELDTPAEVERVAEQILQAFTQAMALPGGEECGVGVSMGISVYPDNGEEMDSLLAAADTAMYDSKRKGKNTYTYFGGTPASADAGAWIVFDHSYHVGVVEIDEQHRELVRLVNRLNGAIKNKDGDEVTSHLYDELVKYTEFHFATEHRLMEQCGYPDMPLHDAEHAHLIEEAVHFKSRLTQGGDLLALQAIKDWLLHHIQFADKPMAKFLWAQGIH